MSLCTELLEESNKHTIQVGLNTIENIIKKFGKACFTQEEYPKEWIKVCQLRVKQIADNQNEVGKTAKRLITHLESLLK